MNRAELVKQARSDLDQVVDGILWAHTDGHHQTNATPKKPTGGHRAQPGDPDHVPGPRWDIGIGNHAARRAYQDAVTRLAGAELRLQVAAYLAGPGRQPLAVRPTKTSTPAELARCVRGCFARLTIIEKGAADARVDAHLEHATKLLDGAWRRLKSLDKGDTGGVATAETPCKVCRIRPQVDKKGGRCHTCAQWYVRNGFERPKHLDEDAVGSARQAQARRRARGEGWGDEAYSNVAMLSPAEWATYPHDTDPASWDGPTVTGRTEELPGDRAERAEERRERRLRALARVTRGDDLS